MSTSGIIYLIAQKSVGRYNSTPLVKSQVEGHSDSESSGLQIFTLASKSEYISLVGWQYFSEKSGGGKEGEVLI